MVEQQAMFLQTTFNPSFSAADTGDAEDPEMWPATYPPRTEDQVTPWLPSDPIPNPEPESPGLGIPDPGIYEATT